MNKFEGLALVVWQGSFVLAALVMLVAAGILNRYAVLAWEAYRATHPRPIPVESNVVELYPRDEEAVS